MARVIALVFVVLALGVAAAHASPDTIRMDDVIPITDVSQATIDQVSDQMGLGGRGMLRFGYHYERVSVMQVDVWRSGGEFIFYDDHYAYDLQGSDLALMGNPAVPLRYRIPPGLLIIVGFAELAVIVKTRRRAWITIAIGAGLLVVAGVLYGFGLGPECGVPALLGLHHIAAALLAVRSAARAEAADAPPPEPAPEPREPKPSGPPRPRPPVVDTDPFRSPPRPTIAAVQPTRRETDVPLVHDPDADKPKLLG